MLAAVFTAIGVYLATLVATYFAVALAAAAADVLDGRDATVRATFLVVPILALEGLGPLAALDRSSALFRAKWGEQLAGTASIGVLFAVFGTVLAVLLLFFGLASGSTPVAVVCVVVGILGAVVAGVLGSAARSVFSVALYRYAAGAGPTGPFTVADLELAVARKG